MSTNDLRAAAGEHTAAPLDGAEWLSGFAEGWRAPRDADSFSDHFEPLLSDRIRLIQPQLPEIVGKLAFRERFARPLFELLSEIEGTLGSSAISEQGDGSAVLFAELTIRGRLPGGRRATIQTIDRITLRDGVAVERVAHFDPLPLLRALALSPAAWPRLIGARLGRGGWR